MYAVDERRQQINVSMFCGIYFTIVLNTSTFIECPAVCKHRSGDFEFLKQNVYYAWHSSIRHFRNNNNYYSGMWSQTAHILYSFDRLFLVFYSSHSVAAANVVGHLYCFSLLTSEDQRHCVSILFGYCSLYRCRSMLFFLSFLSTSRRPNFMSNNWWNCLSGRDHKCERIRYCMIFPLSFGSPKTRSLTTIHIILILIFPNDAKIVNERKSNKVCHSELIDIINTTEWWFIRMKNN